MTILFLLFYLLLIRISRCKERDKTYNESYIYSYIINEEISDSVPSFGTNIIKYYSDVLPVGIYLHPKTGYLFGRAQQACKVNVTVYGITRKEVLKEIIFIQVFKNTSFFTYSSEKKVYAKTNFTFSLSPITLSDCSNYQIVNRSDNQLKIDSSSGVITGYFTEPSSIDVYISCSNDRLDYNTYFNLIVEDEYLVSSFPDGILVNYISEPLDTENRCSFPKYTLFSHPIHSKTIIDEINIMPDEYRYEDDVTDMSFISTYDMNLMLTENSLISFKLISINSVRMYINTLDHVFMEYEGCTYNKMEKSINLAKGNVYIHIDYVGNNNHNELLKLYYKIEEEEEEEEERGGGVRRRLKGLEELEELEEEKEEKEEIDNDEDKYQLLNNTFITTNLLSFMIEYPNNNNIILLDYTYINIKPIIIGLGYITHYEILPELPTGLMFNKENGKIEGILPHYRSKNQNIDHLITVYGLDDKIISTTKITIIYQTVNNVKIANTKTIYSKNHILYWYYYPFTNENIISQRYNQNLIYYNKELDIDNPIYVDTPIIIEYNTILINDNLHILRLYGDFETFSLYIDPSHSYIANHSMTDFILDFDVEVKYYYVSIVITLSHINQMENIKCIINGINDCDDYFVKNDDSIVLLYSYKYITLLYNQSIVIKPNKNLKGKYVIDKELPIGLNFNSNSGMISGKVLPNKYNDTKYIHNHYIEFTIVYNELITYNMYLQLYMISKPYMLLYLNRTDSNKPSFFIFETYSNVTVDKIDYNYGFIEKCSITPFLPKGIYFGRKCEILGIPINVLDYYNFTVTASNIMGEIQQNVSFVVDRCRHGITVNIEITDLDSNMILSTRILDGVNKYKEYYFEMNYNSSHSVDYCIDDGKSTFIFDFKEEPYVFRDDFYLPINVKISFKDILNITEFQIDPLAYDLQKVKVIDICNPPYMLRYHFDYYRYEYGIDAPKNYPLYYNTIKNWTISEPLPHNLTFDLKTGIIDGRVAEIMDLNCYTIVGCNDVLCVDTEVCLEILAHSCYENEYFYSTLVNQKAYRQCENGYFGYKSQMCIINEVNYTGIPEWDESSWSENCYLVKNEPYYAYETVVFVSFQTTIDSYFFSDKFKGRINFFELLDKTHYLMNESSFIDTESNNKSILTKVLFQFTCKERDYYTIKDMILSVLKDVSFPNQYIGSTNDYILSETIIFNPSFYHSIYKQLSLFLLIFFAILSAVSIIFLLYLCKKANRLSTKKKNRYSIKYYIPYADENNNYVNLKNNNNKNKNRKNIKRFPTVVTTNRRPNVYI